MHDGVSTWPNASDASAWHTRDRPDSSGRRWCAALARFPWSRITLTGETRIALSTAKWNEPAISHPGQFALGRLNDANGNSLTIVSLYGVWEYQPEREDIAYSEASLHRAISDLAPVLQRNEPIVIAGDLNVLHGYKVASDPLVPRYDVFDRLAAYGVKVAGPYRLPGDDEIACSCGLGKACRHVATRPDAAGRPWQLDWVLSNLADECIRAWGLPVEPEASDHAPIVIDCTLAPAGSLAGSSEVAIVPPA